MSYCAIVVFHREHDEDDDILRAKGLTVTPTNLAFQLARELQEAYDTSGLAGHFEVCEIVEGYSLFEKAKELGSRRFWSNEYPKACL